MAGLRPLGEAAKALQCKDRGGFSHMQEVQMEFSNGKLSFSLNQFVALLSFQHNTGTSSAKPQ